jgi:hypothetical protein
MAVPEGMANITAKTGKAGIEKLGHTSINKFGRNPHMKERGTTSRTEESAR